MLAGVTAALGLFSMADRLKSTDRVAIELSSQQRLWGFEGTIATASVYAGEFFITAQLEPYRY